MSTEKKKDDKTSATFRIPKDLYKKLKIHCIEEETDHSSVVEQALQEHLNPKTKAASGSGMTAAA